MARYARVENSRIVETREMNLEDIPEHKRSIWLLVENVIPSHDPFYQEVSDTTLDIQVDKVVYQYTIQDKPIEQLKDLITKERDRRIANGVQITVGNTVFTAQTRDETDFRNINGLVSKGILLLMASDLTTTVPFRDADNVEQQLNAQALVSLGEQIAAKVSEIYEYSWALKAMDPIPSDYGNDQYWSETPPE